MLDAQQSAGLLGRVKERAALDRLVAGVRAGQSRVLVLRGEAGIGKTALLGYLSDRASGCRVARAAGIESEMELAFAGLHQLCAPMLSRLDHLPDPQREALNTAFGLSAGPPPDRFLVGLAVLTLLADTAEEQPLVCLVDDAQWLDRVSAQTLAFVARRLLAERVGLVFALREYREGHEFEGLPEVVLAGLGADDARKLLDAALPGPLDERVQTRILHETRGNPLALRELPRGLTPAELAGGFGVPDAHPLASRIEHTFHQRVDTLPRPTQLLLLTAAAEPLGDLSLLWRAAERLGISREASRPAEAAGLIELRARVRFLHPLVRSAVYRASDPNDRRDVHRALADSTDPRHDPDRFAWHRAHAAATADEAVAAELERSATRAQARGGVAAAAAFLERAAALTPDAGRRGARALAASRAKLQAGAFEPARALLATASEGPIDELQQARIDLVRAEIAFASNRGNEAAPLLLAAASRLEPLDVRLARETYLEAISAGMFAGRLASGPGLREVAQAARQAPPPAQEPLKGDMLLDGLTVLFTDGYAAAVPIENRALEAFNSEDLALEEGLRWLWLASAIAADLWEHERWRVLATQLVNMARQSGVLSELPLALNSLAQVHLFAGELGAAAMLVDEANAVRDATGIDVSPYAALGLAAWRGRRPEAEQLIDSSMSSALSRGEGIGVTIAHWARALLLNGLGQFEGAAVAGEQASECPHELAAPNWGLTELIEAAARRGMTELAVGALERLSEMTRASGTDWALGIEARSRALLSEGDTADGLYREAIERLGRTRVRGALARARLLYGEWLRQSGRRVEAREQLRAAHEMLTGIGAEAFADRARRELAAIGETVPKRTDESRDVLTAQEAQIARLARDRHTNPEIAAQLFLSPRTVEYHLHKVFTKLGISSRRDLRAALPDAAVP